MPSLGLWCPRQASNCPAPSSLGNLEVLQAKRIPWTFGFLQTTGPRDVSSALALAPQRACSADGNLERALHSLRGQEGRRGWEGGVGVGEHHMRADLCLNKSIWSMIWSWWFPLSFLHPDLSAHSRWGEEAPRRSREQARGRTGRCRVETVLLASPGLPEVGPCTQEAWASPATSTSLPPCPSTSPAARQGISCQAVRAKYVAG